MAKKEKTLEEIITPELSLMFQIQAMNLNQKQGMKFYADNDFVFQSRKYQKLKALSIEIAPRRLRDIAEHIPEEHLKAYDDIIAIEHQARIKLQAIKDPQKFIRASKDLLEMKPFISTCREAAIWAKRKIDEREAKAKEEKEKEKDGV